MEEIKHQFEVDGPQYGRMGVDIYKNVSQVNNKEKTTFFANVVSMTEPAILSDFFELPLSDLGDKRQMIIKADGKTYYITRKGELILNPIGGIKESLGRLTLTNPDNKLLLGHQGTISYTAYNSVPGVYFYRPREELKLSHIEQIIVAQE